MNIRELLNKRAVKGDVGIEIEVEGENLKRVDDEVWRSVDDGSLRGVFPNSRCEFVLAKPIPIKAVKAALDGLLKEQEGAEFKFSYRTSVHVHVNVQNMEYEQLLAMMYTYYLLEEPLMTFCGKSRKGNNFCLRLADAEGVLDFVLDMFENGIYTLGNIQKDTIRYAAMNIEAVPKYGSLEFRGMEGNLDVERIDTWCKALIAIREFAIKAGDPKKVYEVFQETGPIGFMDIVLGIYTEAFKYARAERDIETSFSISLDLPFSFKKVEIVKNKEREIWEYRVGEMVDYNTAIKIIHNGGHCVTLGPQQYAVKRSAKKPVPIAPVPQFVAINNNEQWIVQNDAPRF